MSKPHARSSLFAAKTLLTTLALATLIGCPREVGSVARPEGATICAADSDCNPPDTTCGMLRACVDERCEATPTRPVHCP